MIWIPKWKVLNITVWICEIVYPANMPNVYILILKFEISIYIYTAVCNGKIESQSTAPKWKVTGTVSSKMSCTTPKTPALWLAHVWNTSLNNSSSARPLGCLGGAPVSVAPPQGLAWQTRLLRQQQRRRFLWAASPQSDNLTLLVRQNAKPDKLQKEKREPCVGSSRLQFFGCLKKRNIGGGGQLKLQCRIHGTAVVTAEVVEKETQEPSSPQSLGCETTFL